MATEQDSFQNNFNDLREDIIFKIQLLKKRGYLCSELSPKLVSIGYDSSTKYTSIISKIRKLESGDVKKTLLLTQKLINDVLQRHAGLANKRLYFYNLSSENLKKIYSKLIDPTNLTDFFIVGETNQDFDYTPAEHDKIETSFFKDVNDTLKVFYLKSGRNRRENIQATDKVHLFSDEQDGEVINVIKVVQYRLNAFDFIALDFKSNILVIGTDLSKIFPREETNKIEEKLKNIVRKIGGLNILDLNNLRNCVENLEHEEGGDVLNHAFMTADGGFNNASNSITSRQDVRKDKYYSDGIKDKEADYYGIVKSYELSEEETVTLTLRLTFRDYKKLGVPIRYAIIDGVTSFSGLQFCIDKIAKHNHN